MKDVMSAAEFRAMMAKREQGRNSKFGAVPTTTGDGQTFDSAWEAELYKTYWVRLRIGEVEKIERQVHYDLVVNHVHICSYRLDLRITLTPQAPEFERYRNTGGIIHIDAKSSPTITDAFRMKQKLMMAIHGIVVEAVVDPSTRSENKPRKRGVKK